MTKPRPYGYQRFGNGKLFLAAFVLTALPCHSGVSARETPEWHDSSSVFVIGEQLEYKVTFLHFTLGTIVITTDSTAVVDGSHVWFVHCTMDSRPGLPFVSLHAVYRSRMDPHGISLFAIESRKEPNGEWSYLKYFSDYANHEIAIEKGGAGLPMIKNDYSTTNGYADALSLIFFIRLNALRHSAYQMPTFVETDTARTHLNFLASFDAQTIDATSYPIACRYFTGTAAWKGIYGLSGKFEGWCSDDAASVPITAHMKLYVGNVCLELVRWSRPGWAPPAAH